MVVQHNLTAMNSNRMLNITTSAQAKSTEKLSSGYKINRAADNAAGLSISEKMRKQIRGLTQATSNAQDGISTVQTAEGALGEVQDMLQRMNELAVQSANGTNSSIDRSAIQSEVNQLTSEIDRVSTTTKFNETYLLKGNTALTAAAGGATVTASGITATIASNATTSAGDYSLGTVGIATAGTGVDGASVTAATVSSSNTLKNLLNSSSNTTGKVDFTNNNGTWTAKSGTTTLGTYTTSELKDMGITLKLGAAVDLTADTAGKFSVEKTLVNTDAQKSALKDAHIATTGTAAAADLANTKVGNDVLVTVKENTTTAGQADLTAYDNAALPKALSLNLHVGADSFSSNKISVSIASMSAKGLGLKDSVGAALDVSTESSATSSITTVASALQKVSDQRASLGAIQNRLEHTIKNLSNVTENTTSAESSIRDTDMATEMVKYSNNNILAQAGQSMLAQANQSNQGVLTLLKG